MSFVKIAEARAVKKIIFLLRDHAGRFYYNQATRNALAEAADDIEAGEWKNVKLPKPKKGKRK